MVNFKCELLMNLSPAIGKSYLACTNLLLGEIVGLMMKALNLPNDSFYNTYKNGLIVNNCFFHIDPMKVVLCIFS